MGMVIEWPRPPAEQDGLMWFCELCNHELHEEYFVPERIERDFPPVFERYHGSFQARACEACGHADPVHGKSP